MGLPHLILLYAVTLLVAWVITAKAGFPGPLALLALLPVGNVILLVVLVFIEWPVRRELFRYRELFGELPELDPAKNASDPTACLGCGSSIPPGMTRCPDCGWTYENTGDS